MARNTREGCGSDVYHRPEPTTDCPVVEIKAPEPLGFQVRVQIQDSVGRRERTFHNVTEIHFRYLRTGDRVAFESDIHGTGQTYPVEDILEFEARLEPRLAEEF